MSDLEEIMEEEQRKTLLQKTIFHKHLAHSFVHMAKANKIGGHIGLYRQYMKYAKEHLDHAKRLKGYLLNGVRITICIPFEDEQILNDFKL